MGQDRVSKSVAREVTAPAAFLPRRGLVGLARGVALPGSARCRCLAVFRTTEQTVAFQEPRGDNPGKTGVYTEV